MGLLSARQEEEVMAEINITPFTDVLLVLLIIFMILATLVTPPGFEKELPNQSSNQQQQQQHKDINVMVNDRGVIFVDAVRANASSIYYVMSVAAQEKPNHHVSITADAKAPYGIIIRILDAAKDAGLQDVGFVTS